MSGSSGIGARLWRPLLGVAIAHAVAIQSLLIAIAGFSLPAGPGQNAPAFELCLHDTSGAPSVPADKPDLSGCTHCIFCFAGAHHAVIGTAAAAVFHRVNVAMAAVPLLDDGSGPRRLARYTIASPRGPPLSA
jgi:hypothetical protein